MLRPGLVRDLFEEEEERSLVLLLLRSPAAGAADEEEEDGRDVKHMKNSLPPPSIALLFLISTLSLSRAGHGDG